MCCYPKHQITNALLVPGCWYHNCYFQQSRSTAGVRILECDLCYHCQLCVSLSTGPGLSKLWILMRAQCFGMVQFAYTPRLKLTATSLWSCSWSSEVKIFTKLKYNLQLMAPTKWWNVIISLTCQKSSQSRVSRFSCCPIYTQGLYNFNLGFLGSPAILHTPRAYTTSI